MCAREAASPRAAALAAELRAAAAALIALVERIEPERWSEVRAPGTWSPGKDAEHVADAMAMHMWHVCHALGKRQSRPPAIERARLTAVRSQAEVASLLRTCAASGAELIEQLTDAQLDLVARPPKTVAEIIARPLIGHIGIHQHEIELKLRSR
jgi:DinB family protein